MFRYSPRLPAEKRLEQADPDPVSFPITNPSPHAKFCDANPPPPCGTFLELQTFLLSCLWASPAAEAARASVYNYSPRLNSNTGIQNLSRACVREEVSEVVRMHAPGSLGFEKLEDPKTQT